MGKMLRRSLILGLALLCVGCLYRMPSDDEYTTVPTTNHPDVTQEKASALPGGSY